MHGQQNINKNVVDKLSVIDNVVVLWRSCPCIIISLHLVFCFCNIVEELILQYFDS